MMISLKHVCVAALIVAVAAAEVAVFRPCDEVPEAQDACEVSQVRVVPCSKSGSPCRLTKGLPASLSFDFTPNFSASKLKTTLFWVSPGGDMAFPELHNADGCQYTGCPTAAGTSQELTYGLTLNKKFPTGIFELKWKLWNEEEANQECCFKTTVQIKKGKRVKEAQ